MDVYRLRWSLFRCMTSPNPSRRALPTPRSPVRLGFFLAALALPCLPTGASAQISFTSAVGLALSNSPRVKMAQADVDKARAAVAEAHDAYYPVVQGIMDLGYSYGAPLGEPTLFSFDAHSLVFNYSQHDYIRAAASGLVAANASLEEQREDIAEDTAATYVALDSARQRRAALVEEYGHAGQLAKIIQDRLDLGQDSKLELFQAQRTAAQIRLQMLQLDDEISSYGSHLARLDGLPDGAFVTETASIPSLPEVAPPSPDRTVNLSTPVESFPDTPAVRAAFANARAKQQQAFGDARYMYRPQVAFFAAYSRFSTFNNYETYYPAFSVNTLNAIGIGIQISIPFYDAIHRDKAGASLADARHAAQQAIDARDQMFEGRIKLQHASAELAAQAELAGIDQQIAQQQLDAVLIQLQAGNGNPSAPQLSPKDEQKARIEERQHYIDFLTARSNLHQTQIRILRLTGELDAWLKAALATQLPAAPAAGRQPPQR